MLCVWYFSEIVFTWYVLIGTAITFRHRLYRKPLFQQADGNRRPDVNTPANGTVHANLPAKPRFAWTAKAGEFHRFNR
jgi:hypothetical protein